MENQIIEMKNPTKRESGFGTLPRLEGIGEMSNIVGELEIVTDLAIYFSNFGQKGSLEKDRGVVLHIGFSRGIDIRVSFFSIIIAIKILENTIPFPEDTPRSERLREVIEIA